MDKPRPHAVVKLSAKIDTSVTEPTTVSTRNVPTTEIAPITTGSMPATTDPKIRIRSSAVIGNAIVLALFVSSSITRLTWSKAVASPPTPTLMTSPSPS
jgi:hypothetical protein